MPSGSEPFGTNGTRLEFRHRGWGDQLVEVLEMVFTIDDSGASCLFIITDRTGEVYADRPDDELAWMELVDLAATADITLLDWFVVYGTITFSVAEFAPLPAQW